MQEVIISSGEIFSQLTVIERAPKYQTKERYKYKCRCVCGAITFVLGYNLKNGHSTSCGCFKGKTRGDQLKLPAGLAAKRKLFSRYKDSANQRSLDFLLSFEQFIAITSKACYYCGADPNQIVIAKGNNGNYLYNGIDRIDSNSGYVLDNTLPCCFTCNRAKGAMHYDEFLEWIRKIYHHMETK